jgi:hypothetical protein
VVLRLVAGAGFGADDLLLDLGVVFAETVLDLDFGLDFVAIGSPQNNGWIFYKLSFKVMQKPIKRSLFTFFIQYNHG